MWKSFSFSKYFKTTTILILPFRLNDYLSLGLLNILKGVDITADTTGFCGPTVFGYLERLGKLLEL